MEGINFEDKNIKFILLPRGKYLIDGEVIDNNNTYDRIEVKVKDENNIRKIEETKIVDYYLHVDTKEKITNEEYNSKINQLLEKSYYDCDYDELIFTTLEDEYAYKKYISLYKPIYKIVQTFSNPLKVEMKKLQYDTENEFIRNCFLNGNSQYDLYVYNQHDAWIDIVEKCFKELKFEYIPNCDYGYTKDKKVWGNSTDSCIRYVKAFGGYVFDDRFNYPKRCVYGTLEDLKEKYKRDYNEIRNIIIRKYNKVYKDIDPKKVDYKKVIEELYHINGFVNDISVKKQSIEKQKGTIRRIDKLIQYLESKYE